ncbi:MAG: flagellar basal body P-ring formation chaperone FlgA [Thermoguttaceae bacterium]|jgi:flagella basal body P-ring formation protein FlgA|nr:flagellar basal body P-ring formation chaperone FlgA [Thermoguttaceae bacterium]
MSLRFRWLVICVLLPGPLVAAEIQLRARCQPQRPVVTLGDMAQINAADPAQAEALSAIELFPAPAGRPRTVRVRELCDLLAMRQVALAEHRFSGASEVTVLAAASTEPAAKPAAVEPRRAGEVVVAVAPIAKGAVVRTSDVRIEPAASIEIQRAGCGSVDEVVGKETLRAIPAGAVIPPESLRAPLLVRRGDVVAVLARAAGVRVRTTARAQDDGALGDPITVESLLNRQKFTVRVTGPRETELEGAPSERAAW